MRPNILKVGMREFRSHLQHYLIASLPVAVTKHGETVGFYIPTRHPTEKTDVDALKKAAVKLEKLLLSSGVTEDELVTEFRTLRQRSKPHASSSTRTRC